MGLDDDLRDDSTGEMDQVDYSLTGEELECLESLANVATSVKDKKGDRFFVTVNLYENGVTFQAQNPRNPLPISFFYDFTQKQVLKLQGADMDWVKSFLNKYQIQED